MRFEPTVASMIQAIGPSPRSASSSPAATFNRPSKNPMTTTNQSKDAAMAVVPGHLPLACRATFRRVTRHCRSNRYTLQTETSVTHTKESTAPQFNRYTFSHSANAPSHVAEPDQTPYDGCVLRDDPNLKDDFVPPR